MNNSFLKANLDLNESEINLINDCEWQFSFQSEPIGRSEIDLDESDIIL